MIKATGVNKTAAVISDMGSCVALPRALAGCPCGSWGLSPISWGRPERSIAGRQGWDGRGTPSLAPHQHLPHGQQLPLVRWLFLSSAAHPSSCLHLSHLLLCPPTRQLCTLESCVSPQALFSALRQSTTQHLPSVSAQGGRELRVAHTGTEGGCRVHGAGGWVWSRTGGLHSVPSVTWLSGVADWLSSFQVVSPQHRWGSGREAAPV